MVIEKVVHGVRELGNLGQALQHVWHHRDRNVMLATVLCLALAYAGYNLYSAVDRRLGEGSLRQMLLRRPEG